MGSSSGSILQDLTLPLATPQTRALSAGLLGAMVCPHCMYAYIWYRPRQFTANTKAFPLSALGDHPVEVFSKLCLGMKAYQLGMLAAWSEFALFPQLAVPAGSGYAVVGAAGTLSPARWGLAGALIAAGQILNIGIYNSIGKDGVYYGFKLGRSVPWATGFPFNLGLRHPQYIGAMLSWVGIISLAAVEKRAYSPLAAVLGIWSCFYAITSTIEESGDQDA